MFTYSIRAYYASDGLNVNAFLIFSWNLVLMKPWWKHTETWGDEGPGRERRKGRAATTDRVPLTQDFLRAEPCVAWGSEKTMFAEKVSQIL